MRLGRISNPFKVVAVMIYELENQARRGSPPRAMITRGGNITARHIGKKVDTL
jgi:hypothetical protein